MKKRLAAALALMLLFCPGCKKNDEKPDMSKNDYAYENKTNSELIPDGTTVEHGDVIESDVSSEIPSEEELGEYKEILLEGDNISDTSCAGWVLAVSLKDITVNTYNKITAYKLIGNGKNCVDLVKPGDAVIISFTENDDGTKSAYDVGRVRMEDSPLTKEEIAEAMEKAEDAEADGSDEADSSDSETEE